MPIMCSRCWSAMPGHLPFDRPLQPPAGPGEERRHAGGLLQVRTLCDLPVDALVCLMAEGALSAAERSMANTCCSPCTRTHLPTSCSVSSCFLPEGFLKFVAFCWVTGYLPWAMQRVYRKGKWGTLWRWLLLGLMHGVSLAIAIFVAMGLAIVSTH